MLGLGVGEFAVDGLDDNFADSVIRVLVHGAFSLLPFAIYARDRKYPEGNQIEPGHQFGNERGEELPVPANQARERRHHDYIQDVVER